LSPGSLVIAALLLSFPFSLGLLFPISVLGHYCFSSMPGNHCQLTCLDASYLPIRPLLLLLTPS
jgi:hypothetical protein